MVAPAYVGLLGLAPIGIGVKQVWERYGDVDSNQQEPEEPARVRGGHGHVVAVAAVTVANGGDNIRIYTPLFATRSARELAVVGIVFLLMTALWMGAAYYLTRHRTLGPPIRRYGQRLGKDAAAGLPILAVFASPDGPEVDPSELHGVKAGLGRVAHAQIDGTRAAGRRGPPRREAAAPTNTRRSSATAGRGARGQSVLGNRRGRQRGLGAGGSYSLAR